MSSTSVRAGNVPATIKFKGSGSQNRGGAPLWGVGKGHGGGGQCDTAKEFYCESNTVVLLEIYCFKRSWRFELKPYLGEPWEGMGGGGSKVREGLP